MTNLRCLSLMFFLAIGSNAWSQDGLEGTPIEAVRQQKMLELDSEDAACLSKFAVTDCQSKVGTRRRQMLAELKRQEGALKSAERQQKGLEQLQKSEDKAVETAQRERDVLADTEKTTEDERKKNLDAKVLSHRAQAKAAGLKSRDGKSTSVLDAATVEKNHAAYQDKLNELEKRRQERDNRLQDRGTGSAPLPVAP